MFWGTRALPLATIVLIASTLTGCAAAKDYAGWEKVGNRGYAPLTADTFARGMSDPMYRYDTVHMDMEIAEQTMSMDVRFGGGEPAMSGTFDDGKAVGSMVLVDGEVYYRDEGAPTYYQFPDRLADEMLAEMEMSDPTEMADDFTAGIDSVDYWGSVDVAYGPAHRYDITMRKEFMAAELGLPIEDVPDFSFRMWLDDDNLVRRYLMLAEGAPAGDVTFSDWGDPVTIEAPPADQVEPLPMPTDET